MSHIIVYFPYELKKNPKSGSGVRPKKLVEAFYRYGEKHHLEVVLISGNSKDRRKKIDQYHREYSMRDALICYMENSTIPFWLTDKDHVPRSIGLDSRFWKKLKQNNVPIGCFYRDVYWQFDDMYVPPFGISLLTPVMKKIYRNELKAYHKVVDVMYLPSLEMNRFVNWKKTFDELPPGMEKAEADINNNSVEQRAVYVGGITDEIGILTMLEGFKHINESSKVIHLDFICREEEFNRSKQIQEYAAYGWITVQHLSGSELISVYKNATIALIPREKNTYHDFAMPVKLFEYLSYQLPIVATDCDAQERFLEGNHFGVISKAEKHDFAAAVLRAIEPSNYEDLTTSIKERAFKNNSWDARVEKVMKDLLLLREVKD